MQRAIGLSAALLAGCADSSATFVPVDRLASEIGFVLALDGSGSLLGLQGPLPLDEGVPVNVALPAGGADSLLFVGWSHQDLVEAVPSYDPAGASGLRISLGAESCSSGQLSRDGTRLDVPLPTNSTILQLRESDGFEPRAPEPDLLGRLGPLTLSLAPDTTRCLGEADRGFEPYGGIDPVVARGSTVNGRLIGPGEMVFRDLERLSDDRVVATTRYSVLLLDRGQPFEDTPERAVQLIDPLGEIALRDVVVDQDPRRGDGGLRVFATAVRDMFPEESDVGYLFELRLGATGLGRVSSATVSGGPLESLLLRPEDGRLVAGSRPGVIYTMLPGERLERVMLPIVDDKRIELYLTDLPDRPYAIAGTAPGTLLLGDPSARQWDVERGLPDGATFRSFAVRANEGMAQFWVGNSSGEIYYSTPAGEWREAIPRLGIDYASCFSREATCGWYEAAQSARAIIPLDDFEPSRILVLFDGCTGIVAMRGDLACSVVTTLGARPVQPTSEEFDLKVMHVNDDWVSLSTQDGSIYELRRGR